MPFSHSAVTVQFSIVSKEHTITEGDTLDIQLSAEGAFDQDFTVNLLFANISAGKCVCVCERARGARVCVCLCVCVQMYIGACVYESKHVYVRLTVYVQSCFHVVCM